MRRRTRAIFTPRLNGADETFRRLLNCLRPAGAHIAVDAYYGGGDQIGKRRAGFGAAHAHRRWGTTVPDVEFSHDRAESGTDPSGLASHTTRPFPAEHPDRCSPATHQRAAGGNE